MPQITARAGLTTRTFFRHFPDKRELLFPDENDMRDEFADFIRRAPTGLAPIGVIEHALGEAADTVFEPRRAFLRQWRAVVAGDEGLRERALRKQLMVTAAVAALHERGIDPRTADMVARVAVLAFETAVGDWLAQEAADAPLPDHVRDALARLRDVVAAGSTSSSAAAR